MEVNPIYGKICVICDDDADIEISNKGSLKLFWACGPHDGEITLCKACAKKLHTLLDTALAE